MGLDRFQKTPCGFCFVEYYTHQDALDCMKYIGGTKLDERIIRTDLDEGFVEGRQYGLVVFQLHCLYSWSTKHEADLVTGEVSLVAKCVTSIEKSTILAEGVLEELLWMITMKTVTDSLRIFFWKARSIAFLYVNLVPKYN